MQNTNPPTHNEHPRNEWDVLFEWIAYDLIDSTDPLVQEACRRVRARLGLPPVQFPEAIEDTQLQAA